MRIFTDEWKERAKQHFPHCIMNIDDYDDDKACINNLYHFMQYTDDISLFKLKDCTMKQIDAMVKEAEECRDIMSALRDGRAYIDGFKRIMNTMCPYEYNQSTTNKLIVDTRCAKGVHLGQRYDECVYFAERDKCWRMQRY